MATKSPLVAAVPLAPAKVAVVAKTGTANTAAPTQNEIAVRAYELFLQDGSANGHDLEHWLRAEEELKSRKKS